MNITRKRIIHFLIHFSLFLSLYAVSCFFMRNTYVLKWTTDRYYLGVWIIVLLFIFLAKKESLIYSYFITAGNFIGIVLGEYVGGAIKKMNMMKISKDMDAENIYRLSKHPGVLIWLITVIFSLILVGIIIKFRNKKIYLLDK